MHGARPIKPSKMKNYRGNFPSIKCGTMIKYESLLERDYIHLLEFDSKVDYYEAQPIKIPYKYKGASYNYYPDFKVITGDNRVLLVEVKPTRFLKKEKNLLKFEVGKRFCEGKNWEYMVVSEENIRVGHLQYNLGKLKNVNFQSMGTNLKNRIIQMVKSKQNVKIGTVIAELPQYSEQELYSHIYSLIYDHILHTDLINHKLTSDSLLTVS